MGKLDLLSDWNAVTELQEHGIAADGAEAAVKALTAGVDMEMTSDLYLTTLEHPSIGKCDSFLFKKYSQTEMDGET